MFHDHLSDGKSFFSPTTGGIKESLFAIPFPVVAEMMHLKWTLLQPQSLMLFFFYFPGSGLTEKTIVLLNAAWPSLSPVLDTVLSTPKCLCILLSRANVSNNWDSSSSENSIIGERNSTWRRINSITSFDFKIYEWCPFFDWLLFTCTSTRGHSCFLLNQSDCGTVRPTIPLFLFSLTAAFHYDHVESVKWLMKIRFIGLEHTAEKIWYFLPDD